jgi:SPP1 family predicted phage head-tail adaptor
MRAGQLDRIITVEKRTVTPDDAGTPQETWAVFASLRAQLLRRSSAEYALKSFGEDTDITTGFRVRWIDGLTLANMRVKYNGEHYRITDIKEIGRRVAQDLQCLKVTS